MRLPQQGNGFARRDVHFATDAADVADHGFQPFDVGNGAGIGVAEIRVFRVAAGADGIAVDAEFRRDGVPDFFGDERNHRVQQTQGRFQREQQGMPHAVGGGFVVAGQCRFGKFQEPVAVGVPGELIERGTGQIETVFGEMGFHLAAGLGQLRQQPAFGLRACRRCAMRRKILTMHQHEARRIP